VRLVQTEKRAVLISVRDEGVGLPADFNATKSKRLSTRLVTALAKQLGAELSRPSSPADANLTLLVPVQLSANESNGH
jgi:two-component sensor histidine kinase